MKRKIFIIAALSLVFALSAALLAGCSSVKEKSEFSVTPASEEYREEVMSSSAAYEYLQWLSSDEMHSRYGSVDLDELSINHGVGKAAFNIAAKMEEMGYETFEGAYIEVDDDGVLSASKETKVTGLMRFETSTGQAGVNVIYRKKATNGSRGQVILTAHFDNLFGRALSGGTVITAEGAYENGAAVATLLYVAQLLQEVETQYDIVFAFLGSSVVTANNTIYYCWDGAKALLSQLPELYGGEYEPVLNINLHRLGGGENLYMYSSDRPTSYNNYFYAAAEADGLDFSAPPAYKHAFSEALSMQIMPSSPSGVYHPGLLTDSIHFINAGIPTLTYLSLDWESGMETANHDSPDLAYTGRDTIENMNMGRGGEQAVKEQLNSVALNIITSVTGENAALFGQAISTAKEELGGSGDAAYGLSVASMVLTWALVIGLLVAAVILRGKNVTKMTLRRRPAPSSPQADPFAEFNKSGDPFEEFGSDKNEGRGGKNDQNKPSGGDDIFEGF